MFADDRNRFIGLHLHFQELFLWWKELNESMFNLNTGRFKTFRLRGCSGYSLYLFRTVYARAFRKDDFDGARMGLILIAAIVFTVRYYYHVLPAETAMMLGGLIMIAIAYSLIKYLKEPKYGFTDEEQNNTNSFARTHIRII